MKNEIVSNGLRFILLIALQVFLLNNINLFGFATPYVYILFILLYPINSNRALFLVLCFILGLTMDIFESSGGIHAAACLFMGYLRPFVLKTSFGVSYEYNAVKVTDMPLGGRMSYVLGLVFVHHLILYALEIFDVSHALLLLKNLFVGVVFSGVLIIGSLMLMGKKAR